MHSADADGLPEDEKVSTDELQEKIQEDLEEYVQSTDIAAMQSKCSDHLPEVPFLIVYTPRTLNEPVFCCTTPAHVTICIGINV